MMNPQQITFNHDVVTSIDDFNFNESENEKLQYIKDSITNELTTPLTINIIKEKMIFRIKRERLVERKKIKYNQ